jgi:hypothetical protein
MAVPVINTVSKTKSTGLQFKEGKHHTHANMSSTYPSGSHTENTNLLLTAVPDGYRLHFFWTTHTGANHSGLARCVGVTSGAIIWSEQGDQTTAGHKWHILNSVKTTGVTEDVRIEINGNGTSALHGSNMIHGASSGDMTYIPVIDGGTSRVHKTMQIDDIDVIGLCPVPSSQSLAIPEIGIKAHTSNVSVQNSTPNTMVNGLSLTASGIHYGTTNADQNREGYLGVLYTYTGKELSMS